MRVLKLLCLTFMFVVLQEGFLLAQNSSITLINKSTNEPITGVSFKYKNQQGISNSQGRIEFQFEEGELLYFSHIAYGNWVLKGDELEEYIKGKPYLRDEQFINLHPVTIIALHGKAGSAESIKFNYSDKLSYDGGAVLSQNAAISGIRKSGSYGFDPVLRGFKYEQLNVVLNGCQSAIAACPNRMDPPTSQMAPNMMDKVEVLKGPHALRYGNALGGTINYVSAKSDFTDKTKVFGRVSGGYESNGELSKTEGLIGLSGKSYSLGLFGSWSGGTNYTDGNDSTIMAGFKRLSYGVDLAFKPAKNQQIKLLAFQNIAKEAIFPALPMDLISDDTKLINLDYKVDFSSRSIKWWNTSVYGSFVDHLMDNSLKKLAVRMANAETNANTKTIGARTETHWLINNKKMYVGADYKNEIAEGKRARHFLMGPKMGTTVFDNAWQNGSISKTALFSEMQIATQKINWVASVRAEYNKSLINDADPDFEMTYSTTSASQINPSISLGGVMLLNASNKVGLWVGRSQRSGSLTERFINYFPVGLDPYEMIGNPEIKPEVNNQVDANYTLNGKGYMLSVDVFAAYLQNFISAEIDTSLTPTMPTSPGVRRYTNVEKAFKTGFEMSFNQQFTAYIKHEINFAYTYAQNLVFNQPLPEIAPFDINYKLQGQFLKNKLVPELNLRYVLKQDRISEEFGETTTPDFFLTNLKLAYNISEGFKVSTGVNNLFNVAYYEHLNRSVKNTSSVPIYAQGQSFYLMFNVVF